MIDFRLDGHVAVVTAATPLHRLASVDDVAAAAPAFPNELPDL
ncbi:MAG TPA: hypothetical protein VGC06_19060 [Actinomycetes bacterium]